MTDTDIINDPTRVVERHPIRWMVRWESVRHPQLGEPLRMTHEWTVKPYIGRYADGQLLGAGPRWHFRSLSAAILHARREMAATYPRAGGRR